MLVNTSVNELRSYTYILTEAKIGMLQDKKTQDVSLDSQRKWVEGMEEFDKLGTENGDGNVRLKRNMRFRRMLREE